MDVALILIITAALLSLSLTITIETIGINRKSMPIIVTIITLAIGIVAPTIYWNNLATNEKPQMVADELGIDVTRIHYDKSSELWLTDETSYRAVFTNQKLIKTKSGIKAHTELESLVKTGETVIK